MPLDTHCPRFSGNGEEVKVVQELLRHSTSRMTVDTYTQALGPDSRAAQSEVVGMIRPRERVFSVYRYADVRVIFGAILDDKKGGPFQISADADRVRHKQFYGPSTNVLVTRFLFKEGIAEREDFLPVGLRQPHLV